MDLLDSGPAPADQAPTRVRDPGKHERQWCLLNQIVEVACDDAFQWEDVASVLRQWTRRKNYLEALARGEPRRNLDGSLAGEPKEPHRQLAAKRLTLFAVAGEAALLPLCFAPGVGARA
jgi:hypothetical protein